MSKVEKITAEDLLEVLTEAGAVEIFLALPTERQKEFSRWVGKARDNESHWRRIDALVMAMIGGPLQPGEEKASRHLGVVR